MKQADLSKNSEKISAMFNGIASDYDKLNRILSFGIDTLWRKKLVKDIESRIPVKEGKKQETKVLDIACGTGDLSFGLARHGFLVTGADISSGMLEIAKSKAKNAGFASNPSFILASAESLSFPDNSFDAATISFGIRNFDKREACLKEIKRVLAPGGVLSILEFAEPRNRIWRAVFNCYFLNITPVIGKMVSSDKSAYSYLPQSVRAFPKYEGFSEEISRAGFRNADYISLSGGIAVLYRAVK